MVSGDGRRSMEHWRNDNDTGIAEVFARKPFSVPVYLSQIPRELA
jgi:hypothetical protein